jgi:hypothetical protein
MIAAIGVEDRTAALAGFTVYLQGITGDKMIAFYGDNAAQANEQARVIHGTVSDWMRSAPSSVGGGSPPRLKLLESSRGTA